MVVDKNTFFSMINSADKIAIFGHIRPDGDCVGSCLGLYNYIKDNIPEKKVQIYLEEIPSSFGFLVNSKTIQNVPDDIVYDLGISLDCSDTDRHGVFSNIYAQSKSHICLDHHKSNLGFGEYYYCDPDASSTAEVVYRFLDNDKISKACAECIYLGIVHDTGVFKYNSTSEQTMICAGKLLSKGINAQYIIDNTFYMVNYNQNRLTGRALLESKLYLDNKVIATCVTTEMFKEYGATKKDTEGIVDKIRVTEGIEVAVFVYQLEENKYKFSLRSIEKVDVSLIAVSFGGGGHIRAAGFEANGDYRTIFEKVLGLIAEQL